MLRSGPLAAISLCVMMLVPGISRAHDFKLGLASHDRTIQVQLSATPAGEIKVQVTYQLELTDTTLLSDLKPFAEQIDFRAAPSKAEACYQAFMRFYAPVFARNLDVKLDGKELAFQCVAKKYDTNDKDGRPLGHPHFEFEFEAVANNNLNAYVAILLQNQPLAAAACSGYFLSTPKHQVQFREGNYYEEIGLIYLAFADSRVVKILTRVEPDEAVKKRQEKLLLPGDDEKLRTLQASFTISPGEQTAEDTRGSTQPARVDEEPDLVHTFLHSEHGFWALLAIFAGLGAVHALTPGHGKTLVAAYLVGERGTVWHALLLGIVTTLTHTGVVFILAIVLLVFFPHGMAEEGTRQNVQMALELTGGLLVAGLGFWLLLRRLRGQADHFHLGSHGHHHHHDDGHHHHGHSHDHGHADHYHDEHGHSHPLPAAGQRVGWWGLIVLGVSGGLVPCWDAVVILILSVSLDALWQGLGLLLAFSAGLAAVLVLVGILVVQVKGFAGSRWGESRLFRSLPLVSAAVVTVMGLWLCYHSVQTSSHAAAASPAHSQTAR
jgi:nickel/cobalt exporter